MKELPRRLWHIFAGLAISIAGLWAPQNIFLPALVTVTIAALILDIVRLRSTRVNRGFTIVFRTLLRKKEAAALTGSTYFLIAASIVFILCDKSLAAISLAFVAVGDPIAGMVGERWGRFRMSPEEGKIFDSAKSPRNLRFHRKKDKSLEGGAACFAACLVVGVILAAVTHVELWVVVVGAIGATLVESLLLLVNDNLSIPLVAAGVMSLAYTFVV